MYQPQPFLTALKAPAIVYRLLKQLGLQKRFIEQHIRPDLQKAFATNDGTLDDNDLKKITTYYGLAVPAILGEAFCALHGKKMSGQERLSSTCQGAMTGLFDDFFDRHQLADETLKEFIKTPATVTGSSNENLFLHFYNTALANATDPALLRKHLYRVYHAQVESKKQAAPGLSPDEIRNITLWKGAESLVFYRVVFDPPMESAETDMLYRLGGLMQLSNDIFDIYKDHQQGIQTLLTTTKKIQDVRSLFLELLKEGYTAAYRCAFPPANIKGFLDIISLGIFSRCFVCLDQLESKELLSNNVFDPGAYRREDLVCDMDTAKNKWKSVKYHILYAP